MSTSTNPVSQARLDTNRANAQRSTGPKTAEGKARVSQNHRIHGLTSKRIQIENPEEQQAYDELRALQMAEHNPQTSSEQHLFEEILHSMWIIEKVRICQGESFDAEGLDGLETEDEQLRKTYDRLERYATRAQNTWFRCRKTLKIIQNERIAIQSQENVISVVDLVAELRETEPPTQKPPATEAPEEEFSEVDRKIMQLDPNHPEFVATAERLIQENLLAEFSKLAADLAKNSL